MNIKGVFIVFTMLLLLCVVFSPFACKEKDETSPEPKYKTSSNVRTILHEGHMFVLYSGFREGGVVHHPSCTHTDCIKKD